MSQVSPRTDRIVRFSKIALVAIIFAVLPLVAESPLLRRLFFLIVVFAMFGLALNVVFGHTDQLYLFVGALAGVDA